MATRDPSDQGAIGLDGNRGLFLRPSRFRDTARSQMGRALLIGLAGGLGTLARYAIGLWARHALGTGFPYGTLIVNVAGCFLISIIVQIGLMTTLLSPTVRLTLTTGFIGGLTTYSSFNLETTLLLREHAWVTAFANVSITIGGCFVAGLLGFALATRMAER